MNKLSVKTNLYLIAFISATIVSIIMGYDDAKPFFIALCATAALFFLYKLILSIKVKQDEIE